MLTGEDPVFTWVSGTGARPTLQALPDGLRAEFEEEFKARLRAAYPARDYGVVLPFRRIFVGRAGRRGMRLHHVQVACPPGGEDARPPLLRRRPRPDRGREARRPARPAAARGSGRTTTPARSPPRSTSASRSRSRRPARRTRRCCSTTWPTLEAAAARLARLGFEVDWTERHTFPGHERFHTFDAHGNRVELRHRLTGVLPDVTVQPNPSNVGLPGPHGARN